MYADAVLREEPDAATAEAVLQLAVLLSADAGVATAWQALCPAHVMADAAASAPPALRGAFEQLRDRLANPLAHQARRHAGVLVAACLSHRDNLSF